MSASTRTQVGSFLAFLTLIAASSGNAQASDLWSANWGGGLCCYTLDTYSLSPTTGGLVSSVNIPGANSRAGVQDFASDPTASVPLIWSINSTSESGYRLLSFNPYQKTIRSNVQLDNSLSIESLALDPTSGKLYGGSATALYQLNPQTGAATLLGPTSLPIDGALGFDLTGHLFGFAGLGTSHSTYDMISVNKLTGATTVIATLPVAPADIAARPEDGAMFGLGYGPAPTGTYSLYQIDTTSGAVSDVHDSLFRPSGLAFVTVPEPATCWLALGAVAVTLRRRRRAS